MATNRENVNGRQISATPTDGGALSGDPCLLGNIPGVALIDAVSGVTTIDTEGVYNLSVHSIDGAIAAGDIVYYVPGNTPKLSDDVDGASVKRFGYALAAVGNGATATIPVKLGY